MSNSAIPRTSKYSREWAIVGGVYLLDALALVVVLSLYRMATRPSFGNFLSSAAGLAFVGALLGGVLITAVGVIYALEI